MGRNSGHNLGFGLGSIVNSQGVINQDEDKKSRSSRPSSPSGQHSQRTTTRPFSRQTSLGTVDLFLFKHHEEDEILDEFGFNILTLQSVDERHRIVWAILSRNEFVQ